MCNPLDGTYLRVEVEAPLQNVFLVFQVHSHSAYGWRGCPEGEGFLVFLVVHMEISEHGAGDVKASLSFPDPGNREEGEPSWNGYGDGKNYSDFLKGVKFQ